MKRRNFKVAKVTPPPPDPEIVALRALVEELKAKLQIVARIPHVAVMPRTHDLTCSCAFCQRVLTSSTAANTAGAINHAAEWHSVWPKPIDAEYSTRPPPRH